MDLSKSSTREMETVEYRPPRSNLWTGIVCFALFLAMDVWSVWGAYTNIDGSFRYPIETAWVCGIFWSMLVLLGLFLIIDSRKRSLQVSPAFIRFRGIFGCYEMTIAGITHAEWRQTGTIRSLVLQSPNARRKISLSDYANPQALYVQLHDALHMAEQVGYREYEALIKPFDPNLKVEARNETICKEYRPSKDLKVLAWISMTFSVFFAAGTLVISYGPERPECPFDAKDRQESVYAYSVLALFVMVYAISQLYFYERVRLFVSPEILRWRGLLRRWELPLKQATRARWHAGNLRERGLKIEFAGSWRSVPKLGTLADQREQLLFIRHALPLEIQEGWNRIEDSCKPKPPLRPGSGFVLSLVLAVVFSVFGAFYLWCAPQLEPGTRERAGIMIVGWGSMILAVLNLLFGIIRLRKYRAAIVHERNVESVSQPMNKTN